jgi:hypothetical protein
MIPVRHDAKEEFKSCKKFPKFPKLAEKRDFLRVK